MTTHLFLYAKISAGGEGEGNWLLPDVLVNVLRAGDDGPGVVREVLGVCVAESTVAFKDIVNCFVSCAVLIILSI
jgi:hypothetical protein